MQTWTIIYSYNKNDVETKDIEAPTMLQALTLSDINQESIFMVMKKLNEDEYFKAEYDYYKDRSEQQAAELHDNR
jgi:hypothetical protein